MKIKFEFLDFRKAEKEADGIESYVLTRNPTFFKHSHKNAEIVKLLAENFDLSLSL